MFGVKTEAQRQKAVQTLSFAYALIVWTFLGYVFYYVTNKSPEFKEKEKTGMPYEEELNRGGALWWIANSGRTDIKEEDEIHVWKFKGFSSFEKERITHKAKAVTEAVQAEIAATSDDLVIRRMMGLPLQKDGGMSDEELRETMQAMGKDYELEVDYARQMARRRELEQRTDAELEALGTFEGKVKLYFRQLRRTLRRKLSREESGIENSSRDESGVENSDEKEVLPAEAGREDKSMDAQVQTPETPAA